MSLIYQTRDDARATDIPTGTDSIFVLGYAEPGDGGAAIWTRVGPTQPPGDPSLSWQDDMGTGDWWILSPHQVVNPKMIGAKGNSNPTGSSGDDDQPYIEALFNYPKNDPNDPDEPDPVRQVYLLPGFYRVVDLDVPIDKSVMGPGVVVPLDQTDESRQWGATLKAGIKAPEAKNPEAHGGFLIGGAGLTPEGTYLQASGEGLVEFFPSRWGQPMQFQIWGDSAQGFGEVTGTAFHIDAPGTNHFDLYPGDPIWIASHPTHIASVSDNNNVVLDDAPPGGDGDYCYWISFVYAEHIGVYNPLNKTITRTGGDVVQDAGKEHNIIYAGLRHEVMSIDTTAGTIELTDPLPGLWPGPTEIRFIHRWRSGTDHLTYLTMQAARGHGFEMNITYYCRPDSAGIRVFRSTNTVNAEYGYYLPYNILGEPASDDPYGAPSYGDMFTNPYGYWNYMTFQHGNVGIHMRDPVSALHVRRNFNLKYDVPVNQEETRELGRFEVADALDENNDPVADPDSFSRRLSILSRNNQRGLALQGYGPGMGNNPNQICIQPNSNPNSKCHFGSWDEVPSPYRFRIAGNTQFSAGVNLANIGTANASANLVLNANNDIVKESSSLRFKTCVEPIQDDYSSRVWELEPVFYRSTAVGDDPGMSHWGFIAEQVAEVDPRLVSWETTESGGRIPSGVLHNQVCALLFNELKKEREVSLGLSSRIRQLESRVSELAAQSDENDAPGS